MLVVHVPFKGLPLAICAEETETVPRGAVLVRNISQGARKGAKEGQWTVYPKGLFQAMRGQTHHTQRGYQKEFAKLRIMVDELPTALQLSWKLPGKDPVAIRAYKKKLLQIIAQVKRARDPKKAEALEKLELALTCVDSLGRFNPPAMSARLGAALSRGHDRIEVAHIVSHQMDARRMAISIILDRIWAMVKDLGSEVVRDRTRFDQIRDDADKREAMAQRLDRLADRFAQVDVAPYGTHAFPHEVEDLRTAATAVRSNAVQTFRAATDRIERSVQFLYIQRRVEEALSIASLAKDEGGRLTTIDKVGATKLVRETLQFLQEHTQLDRGFKKKIQVDVEASLAQALEAAKDGDAERLYEALKLAVKCF